MHVDEVAIDDALVRALLREQAPALAALPLAEVEHWGTDHGIWRLGADLVVRLPRVPSAAELPEREATWLPVFARHVAVEVPVPVFLGRPSRSFRWSWGIHRWLEGTPAASALVSDTRTFALDLAAAVRSLWETPTAGAPPAHGRSRALVHQDDGARRAIASATGIVDTAAATALWDAALAAPARTDPPVWVHADLDGNLLVRDGRLSGIVDWGTASVGDPAADVAVVWSGLFDDDAARVFVEALGIDDATVARSRAIALQQACGGVRYYAGTNPPFVASCRAKLRRVGLDLLA
jgi:aminoglycoside phosphotransferase (APT) family kinase protein